LLLVEQDGGPAGQQLLLDVLHLERRDDVALQQAAVALEDVDEDVDVLLVDVDLDFLEHGVEIAGRRWRDGPRQVEPAGAGRGGGWGGWWGGPGGGPGGRRGGRRC